MAKGAVLTAADVHFLIAPTFETAQEEYAWLNHIHAIGKVVAVKGREGGFVTYDLLVAKKRASLLGATSEYSQRGRGFPAGTAKRAEGYPDNDCQRQESRFRGRSFGANMRPVGAKKAVAD